MDTFTATHTYCMKNIFRLFMTAAVIVILVNTVFDKHSLQTGLSVLISLMPLGYYDTNLLIWCLSWEATQAKYANTPNDYI